MFPTHHYLRLYLTGQSGSPFFLNGRVKDPKDLFIPGVDSWKKPLTELIFFDGVGLSVEKGPVGSRLLSTTAVFQVNGVGLTLLVSNSRGLIYVTLEETLM